MGKRRGLGIKRGVARLDDDYNQYVKPVYDAYGRMIQGKNPFPNANKKLREVVVSNRDVFNSGPNGGDDDPSPPNSNSRMNGHSMVNAKRHPSTIIECPYRRGVGYKAPGPIFHSGARQIKHQFAMDLTSAINHRQFTRMLFRSYARYTHRPLTAQPAVLFTKTLAPSVLNRVIDGITVATAVRDGNMSSLPTTSNSVPTLATSNKEDIFLPLCTLQDLEVASWNANPLKFVSFNMENGYTEGTLVTQPSVATQFKPLQVLADWRLDKTAEETVGGTPGTVSTGCSSPFDTLPAESNSYGGFTQRPENYLCNLGPGAIKFHFQNRLNTSAEIEIVVCRLRMEPGLTNTIGGMTDNTWRTYELQCDAAYLTKNNTGTFGNTGFNGESAVTNDLLVNPTKPFMKCHKKYLARDAVMTEVSRDRFRIQGGATRLTTIKLPELVYDAWQHRRWNWSWNETSNSIEATTFSDSFRYVWPHSYVVYVSTQGVLMPCFTATKIGDVVSNVGKTVVDTQVSPSSILIHGEYVENPRPCLSVSPTSVVQQKPEMVDARVVVASSANGVLLSGYVTEPPVATTVAPVATTTA